MFEKKSTIHFQKLNSKKIDNVGSIVNSEILCVFTNNHIGFHVVFFFKSPHLMCFSYFLSLISTKETEKHNQQIFENT